MLLYWCSSITDSFDVPDNINKDVTRVYVTKQTQTGMGAKRICISTLIAWTLSITVAQEIVSSSSLNTQLSKKLFVQEKL